MNETGGNRPHLFVRVLIMFVAAALIWLVIKGATEAAFGVEYSRASHIVRAVLATLLTVPAVMLLRRVLDRRPWETLGLRSLGSDWRPFLTGAAFWMFPAAAAGITVVALGWTEVTLRTSVGEMLLTAVSLVPLVFLYEALPEELIFRGYFYRNLADRLPRWAAVAGQAALFTAWDLVNGGETSLDRSAMFFSVACILGMLRAVTGSVWTAVGFHLAFQTVAQLFGEVGGQFIIEAPAALTTLAFGAVPLAVTVLLIESMYRGRLDWNAREAEPIPAA